MPLTKKGRKIMKAMKKQYGKEKGKQVFYASANKGKIKGVHGEDIDKYATPEEKQFLKEIFWSDHAEHEYAYKDGLDEESDDYQQGYSDGFEDGWKKATEEIYHDEIEEG